MKEGYSGEILELKALTTRPYISMRRRNFKLPYPVIKGKDYVSENGSHYGVHIKGFVFDNIFQDGVSHAEWPLQFACDTNNFTCSVFRTFKPLSPGPA